MRPARGSCPRLVRTQAHARHIQGEHAHGFSAHVREADRRPLRLGSWCRRTVHVPRSHAERFEVTTGLEPAWDGFAGRCLSISATSPCATRSAASYPSPASNRDAPRGALDPESSASATFRQTGKPPLRRDPVRRWSDLQGTDRQGSPPTEDHPRRIGEEVGPNAESARFELAWDVSPACFPSRCHRPLGEPSSAWRHRSGFEPATAGVSRRSPVQQPARGALPALSC